MDPFEELAKLLPPGAVVAGAGVRKAYECDAYSVERREPACVLLPTSTEDVSTAVGWCHRNGVPFTPRGAGTGLSGGSMPALGGIVISTKRLKGVLQVCPDDRCLLALAGTPNVSLSQAAKPYGLHFAPDPSSQSVCTLGGNIAENSGGPHTLKYGVTLQHVLQATLVTAEGEVRQVGSRVGGAPGLDFLNLLVGSEGTLGIVTEAWVKLVPLPSSTVTFLASFETVRAATEAVGAMVRANSAPSALELMDANILAALKSAFGLDFPSGTMALLLVEYDGSQEDATFGADEAERICLTSGAIEIERAKDEQHRAKLWQARKKGIGAMGRLAPTIVTHDGVIPPSKLPEMLDFVYSVADDEGLGVANIFHAGDGNLHPCFYFDEREPGAVERVVRAGGRILARCVELGGSVTGEHGVGVEKTAALKSMLGETGYRAQAAVRSVFRSGETCNPCKIVPDQKGCVEHRARWKGAAT